MADGVKLFRNGQLTEALVAQTDWVRSNPTDHPARLFLFELLAFSGEVDRAGKQIAALSLEDPELILAAKNYHDCLESERTRRLVLSGGKPVWFPDMVPGPSASLRLEACEAHASGDMDGFVAKLAAANECLPDVHGTLNGKSFTGLRDADDLFAGVLEVFAKGNYYWVPFDQIASLAMNAPRFPRDLLWIPANLTLVDGATGPVFLPALYLGSQAHGLETVRLGRERDWMPLGAEPTGLLRGYGPKVFLAGDDEMNLADFRELTIDS